MNANGDGGAVCAELTTLSDQLTYTLPDSVRHGAAQEEIESLNFRPRPHHGTCLGELDRSQRQQIMRLISCVTAPNTFALIATVMGLEDVIGQRSDWSKDQTRDDYWFALYPRAAGLSRFKFEGHHLSITAAWSESELVVSPVCLGAYPGHLVSLGQTLLRPLAVQSQLGREIIELEPELLAAPSTPREILADGPKAYPPPDFGMSVLDVGPGCRDRIVKLVCSYFDLASAHANREIRRSIAHDRLRFAWMGSLAPTEDHYFLVHDGRDLCIEYINQCHQETTANHEHTVIRSRRYDFGNGLVAL